MTLGPVVRNSISKDVAGAVERGGGDGSWGGVESLKAESED
jgi:hypothetical protein